ncbi:MAG TPA: hypothetical protein VK752_02235 [Bryobacteraceae bacterium]|nr:hypothetical protein [Bryobacteraceae bacterium]
MKSRSFWKRFGACAILAGLAIAVASRFTERRKETEVSAQILERLSSREASAVAQLFQTSLNTQSTFSAVHCIPPPTLSASACMNKACRSPYPASRVRMREHSSDVPFCPPWRCHHAEMDHPRSVSIF